MEDSQVADYFVVTGLPEDPEPMDDYSDQSHLKQSHSLAPITDITVIFPDNDEYCPDGWECLDQTPTGLTANLNYGSMNSGEVYICYRRGRDKPPLVDIGVLYENKDRILADSEIVLKTPTGRSAIVNSTTRTFLTYRRAKEDMHANELVVTDICVIIASKGERPPHAFCEIKKNLNKGLFGGEVYLCYKKSMNRAHVISYKPGILCRYPLWDRPDWKLHSNVPLFCLPMGASLEVWPPEASQPATVFSTFILTVSDAAEKVYGSAVTFYERYPVEKLTEEQLEILKKSLENEVISRGNSNPELHSAGNDDESDTENCLSTLRSRVIPPSYTVNVNKCICLLSHWPFFDTFETFLNFLYKLSTTGPHSVPIERYISHFLENVPFPSPQRPRILVQLSADERVVLFQPEDIPLPRSGAGFRDLLLNLGSEGSLLVLLLVLTEHKILVHSLRASILTAVVEAISMIIFPFKWQCPYIPLCPLGLAEVLHAPLPFLIGVDSRFFDLYDPPADVTCVDLDTNNITVPEERRSLSYKLLPKKAARNLKSTLEELYKECCEEDNYMYRMRAEYDDADGMMRFHLKEREQRVQLEIQEAFLRFMATILKGYRSYLLPITKAPTVGTTDPNSLFDLQGFLKSRDRAHHKFFVMLMKTQMFIRFIEERSFVSDMDAGLAFFDECTEKVDSEDGAGRWLDFEESHRSERTVFIPPPEPVGLPPGATYSYDGFNLDNNLFKHRETKNSLNVSSNENMPGSPMARRTKHEVKSAQKLARRKHSQSAQSWAKCLLTTCYSLWFIHLPSFVLHDPVKASTCLKIAYDLLVKIQKLKLHPTDEVCYRVMMQLFGIHSQPVLAVNLLSQMKMCGIQPNALTYGYYNRAVLEATWPSDLSNPSHLWSKLRNVIVGAALFRRGGHRASRGRLPEAESWTSLASIEKADRMSDFEKFDRKRSSIGSIVKPHPKNLQELAANQSIESIAGILMTGLKKSSPVAERRNSFSEFSPKLQQSTSVSSEANASRLRRGSMSPTLPENKLLKILMRSDSFANDTSIVEKHNRSKKVQADLDISGVLSVPRESSESLDITDDFSLDDSWNSGRNSLQNNFTDTPTKNLLSKLGRLGPDVWSKSNWKTSQESVDSTSAVSGDKSPQQSILPKTDDHCDSKSLLEMSEDVAISNFTNKFSEAEDAKSDQPGDSEEVKSPDKTLPNGEFVANDGSNGSSPVKISPVRVPVTENDPLGALQAELLINGDKEAR
ncbi:UNVERIFIED_CONTAM: hypothetical protein PYX00_004034 [Menopon gallinae]|uniref:C-myc promoter-binding protein n=1 Tax=Menopon gallinae TaxID=328185 RepID=A0AAW2I2A0_9NEOP